MSDKFRIFLHTFVLYALTLALGIVAVWRHAAEPLRAPRLAVDLTLQDAIIFATVFLIFTFVLVRFVRFSRIALRILLVLALGSGIQFIFSAWLPGMLPVVVTVLFVTLMLSLRRVAVHDLAIIVGLAGVAGLVGLSMTPLIAAAMLAILSIYDIVSVYRTRTMVALAGEMLRSGAVFGFLVPARLAGFLMPVGQAIGNRSVMVLGSGDIGLPLVLAASSVSTSLGAAVMVAGFTLVGVMGMQWLFVHQERPVPMAALPPIAASAVLGYVVAILLGI